MLVYDYMIHITTKQLTKYDVLYRELLEQNFLDKNERLLLYMNFIFIRVIADRYHYETVYGYIVI